MTVSFARFYLAVLFVLPFVALIYELNAALLPVFLIMALLIIVITWLLTKI